MGSAEKSLQYFSKSLEKETSHISNLLKLPPQQEKIFSRALNTHSDIPQFILDNLGNNLEKSTKAISDRVFFPPSQLCCSMPINEFQRVQQLFLYTVSPPKFFSLFQDREKLIPLFPNDGILENQVRPFLKWNIQEARYEMTWSSLSLTGIFWLMLMLDLLGPGKILSCPYCQKFFLTGSDRVRFCSFACGNNYKVQKFQGKRKELDPEKEKKKSKFKFTFPKK